jgi:hypothetical protein
MIAGGFLGLKSLGKRKKPKDADPPEEVGSGHPNNTPTEGAKPPDRGDLDEGRDGLHNYELHHKTNLFQNPKFAMPVGIVSGIVLDPDFILMAYKQIRKLVTGAKSASKIVVGAAHVSRVVRAARIVKSIGSVLIGSNPVSIAFTVVMIIGAILDGVDPKGYKNIHFNKDMEKLKKIIWTQFRHQLAISGIPSPVTTSPMNKLGSEETGVQMGEIYDEIYEDPYTMENVFRLFRTKRFNDERFETQLELQDFMRRYAMTQPMGQFDDEVYARVCIRAGGKVVKLSDSHPLQCSYKDKESCDMSYSWPDFDEDEDMYAEWNDARQVCELSPNRPLRKTCEDNKFGKQHMPITVDDPRGSYKIGLRFNKERSNCEITRPYCEDKGGINFVSRDYGPDCHVPALQSVFELLTSQYLVRAFR